jgi:hypothetical protein
MSDSGVMVSELLPNTFNGMEGVVRDELSKNPAMGLASSMWGFVGSTATDAIRSRLNFDVVELLGRGWVFARELHEYKDPVKHPRGQSSILHLGEHKMTTELHPVLTLMIGPLQPPALRFTLEITAHIRSAALAIRDGHITGLGSGDCFLSAQLKYREFPLHNPLETRRVTLPGHYPFKAPGLAIL